MGPSHLGALFHHGLEAHMILISAVALAIILFLFSSSRFLWAVIGLGLLVYLLLVQ